MLLVFVLYLSFYCTVVFAFFFFSQLSFQGVRNAAQRKLLDELGIPAEDVPVDQFTPLGRMLYKAPSDGKWGEHERKYYMLKPLFSKIWFHYILEHIMKQAIFSFLCDYICICGWIWRILSLYAVDYLLFIVRDVSVHPNPDEVADVKFVNQEQLKELLRKADAGEEGLKLSPWFRLVVDNFLFKWWDHVEKGTLREAADMKTIHKL